MKNSIKFVVIAILAISCVSKKSYDQLSEENQKLKAQLKELGISPDEQGLISKNLSLFLNSNLATQKQIDEKKAGLESIRKEYEEEQISGDGGVDRDVNTFEHDPNRGRLFKRSDLQPGIDEYEKWIEPLNQITTNYLPKYFFFGKNRLDELTALVANYQPPSSDPKMQIGGYLVKLAFKRHPRYRVNTMDAIIVPVRLDGEPIFDMALRTKSGNNPSALDESGPCPDECPK